MYFHSALICFVCFRLGYEGTFVKRASEDYPEGCATFYRSSRFSVSDSASLVLRDLVAREVGESGLAEDTRKAIQGYLDFPDVVLIARLRCNTSGSLLTVGNTHIHWTRESIPNIQALQVGIKSLETPFNLYAAGA